MSDASDFWNSIWSGVDAANSVYKEATADKNNADSSEGRAVGRSTNPNYTDLNGSNLNGSGGGSVAWQLGGGGGVTDAQREAVANMRPLAIFNLDTVKQNFDNMSDVYGEANKAAEQIAAKQGKNAEKFASNEWFSRYLNHAQVFDALRDREGNAAYGSDFFDIMRKVGQSLDAQSVEVLESLGKTLSDIDTDLDYTHASNDNATRELAANTATAERNLAGQHIADLNNINPAFVNGEEGDKIIDTDENTVTVPDYLKIDTYQDLKPESRTYDFVSQLFRPDQAYSKTTGGTLESLYDNALQSIAPHTNTAANKRYWDTMTRDYGHRIHGR